MYESYVILEKGTLFVRDDWLSITALAPLVNWKHSSLVVYACGTPALSVPVACTETILARCNGILNYNINPCSVTKLMYGGVDAHTVSTCIREYAYRV